MTRHVAEILSGLGSGVGATLKLCNMLSLWEQVVDARVGKHTKAVKIRNRVLSVSTSSPAWAQELAFIKGDIIEKFNNLAGDEVIRDIRFKSGGF